MASGPISAGLDRRLTEAREARGLSQTALAQALGLSRGAIGQWETGETAPSTRNLAAAARELQVSFDWLATGRGERVVAAPAPRSETRTRLREVPLLSWVSAGKLAEPSSQIPVEDVPLLAFADLGRGEFFALKVAGDSMDRVSPDGSVIVVNRADRTLVTGKPYVFAVRGETTYKIWNAEPAYLTPYSTNPANKPIFITRKRDFAVIGRVRRTLLDL